MGNNAKSLDLFQLGEDEVRHIRNEYLSVHSPATQDRLLSLWLHQTLDFFKVQQSNREGDTPRIEVALAFGLMNGFEVAYKTLYPDDDLVVRLQEMYQEKQFENIVKNMGLQ